MSALTTVPKRRRHSIIARIGWSRFLQEIGMLAPAVLLMTVFLITPFLLSFWTAMTNQPLVPRPTPVRFVGFNNFLRILSDDLFWTSLWNVTRFTLWILPVQCGLAFATALILNQKNTVPERVSRHVLPAGHHLDGGGLRHLGHAVPVPDRSAQPYRWCRCPAGISSRSTGWGDPNWAMFSIVLLSAWQAYGFQMIIYLAGMQGIPRRTL